MSACGARTGLDMGDEGDEDAASKEGAAGDAVLVDAVVIDALVIDALDGSAPAIDAADADDAAVAMPGALYVAAGPFDAPTLFRFDPLQATLTPVGPIQCATGSAWLLSMTTDRHRIMRFADSDGYLYRVESAGLTCTKEAYQPGQGGFTSVQIAWAADPTQPGNPATLFAVTASSQDELAKIDVTSWMLTPVGALDQTLELPRLAGSDDGRLFGLAFTSPIVEIDRQTGHVTTLGDIPQLSGLGGGLGLTVLGDEAFAFRGTTPGLVRFAEYSLSALQVVQSSDVPVATGNDIIGAGVLDHGP
jgi:hypothetical protein